MKHAQYRRCTSSMCEQSLCEGLIYISYKGMNTVQVADYTS